MTAPQTPAAAGRAAPDWWFWGLLALAALYVGCQLTPSSYAYALERFGVSGGGPWLGKARGIRSDEWAVWTPYLQATVHNHFERWNTTSLYVEDLRNFNALPLWDWALIFKPYFWPFFVVDPATAFSFYHASLIVAFLLGYRALFAALGLPRAWAGFFAVLLYFAGFTQHWWTTIGPTLAFFPALLLALAVPARGRWALAAKGALLAYVAAFWLLSHLYPPLIISLAFAGAALLLCLRPDLLKRPGELAAIAGGVAAGLVATGVYLVDPIRAMLDTVYPGARVSDGGGVSWRIFLGQFLPSFNQAGLTPLGAENICESSSLGSWMVLALLCFSRRRPDVAVPWGKLAALLLAAAALSAWMLAPISAAWGRWLLWDKVPPMRMLFASGLLLAVATALWVPSRDWRLTPRRVAVFAALSAAAWIASKLVLDFVPLWKGLLDLAPAAVLGALVARPAWQERFSPGVVVPGTVLAANIALFGFFNPLQPAGPIFAPLDSPKLAAMREKAAAHPVGWLAQDGYAGAVLNGAGFASVAHTLITPQTGFFRLYYPDLPQVDFDWLFKRYHTLVLDGGPAPLLKQADLVQLPTAPFLTAPPGRPARLNPERRPAQQRGGGVTIRLRDGEVVLRGWAPWRGLGAHQQLEIYAPQATRLGTVMTPRRARWEGPEAPLEQRLSGFAVPLLGGEAAALAASAICVVAVDPGFGRLLLTDPAHPDACGHLLEPRP